MFGKKANRRQYTVSEVARMLGLSNKTIYTWIYTRKIRAARPPHDYGLWLIDEDEVARVASKMPPYAP